MFTANRVSKSPLILPYASSRITPRATGIPRRGYRSTTPTPIKRFRNSPRASSNGANCWVRGLVMDPKLPVVSRRGSFVRRRRTSEKRGWSARNGRRNWRRRKRRGRRRRPRRRPLRSSKSRHWCRTSAWPPPLFQQPAWWLQALLQHYQICHQQEPRRSCRLLMTPIYR